VPSNAYTGMRSLVSSYRGGSSPPSAPTFARARSRARATAGSSMPTCQHSASALSSHAKVVRC